MAAEPPAKLDFKSRRLVNQIVEHVKSQGIFDQFRRDCIEELEQKESYRQLKQRVESHVATFLSKQTWTDGLPKNQVRDSLRKHINQSDVLDRGVKQLISQALESKAKAFQTRIEGVVQNYIYMQKHPQNQGKPARKLRMVDSKEETKPSTSEVISDISQLIPIPCSASTGSKTSDSFGVEKGKSVTQEGSKSGPSSRGVQQGKKSHSTQGKTSVTPGKGEEIKSGTSSVREKELPEESVRAKDRKTKSSRIKKESLSRDDYSQLSPKPDENLHKVKDEKTKISRVKIENSNPSGGSPSSVGTDSSSLIPQDERINSRKGMRENVAQSQLLPAGESGFSKSDVARLSQVKIEKANESDSHACSSLESKGKEKEQRSRIPGVKIESSESTVIQQQQKEVLGSELKLTSDPPKEHDRSVLHGGISKIDAGVQRSDNFVEATRSGETSERVAEKRDADVPVILNENKVKELEGGQTAGKLERNVENTREEKRDLRTDSSLKMRSALDPSSVKDAETLASKTGEELSSNKKEEVIEQTRLKDESQRQKLSDERGHPPTQKEDTVRAESVSETMGLESSFMGGENVGHASSTGEYSDGESDISEVSSVHTSDLSSFDEEISSSSESYNDEDENARACQTETYKGDKNEDQGSYSGQQQGKQDSDTAPTRRSTRISSRRSTKEGESEISEGEESKTKTDSPRRRRRDEKTERRTRREAVKGQSKSDAKKRGRGRPRKDERHASSHSGSQLRRSRARDQEGSGSREERTKRSQRPIKRTRCYSPSSEGTREVFLPRKRSRDDPV